MWKNIDKNLFAIFVIFLIIQAAYIFSEDILTGHHFGVPLDDVWIHFRFAENFAHGHFYQFNVGEPTPGSTSPIWVIILSIPFLFSDGLALPFALIITSLFFLLTLIELYKLCVRLGFDGNYSLLIIIITMLCGRLAWSSLSGMEITFFCYLSVLVFRNHLSEIEQNKIYKSTGLLLGLAAVTRPEAYLLAAIYYLVTILILRKSLKGNLFNLFLSMAGLLLIILPYPIFCYIYTGGFLPNTYQGQVGDVRYLPNFQFLVETGKLFVKDNFFIVILWFAGIIYFIRTVFRKNINKKFLLINLWVILLPAISAFIAPNWRHHGRYLIPLIPFINIIAINILLKVYNRFKAQNYSRYSLYRKIAIAVLLFLSADSTFIFAKTLGWNVENINDQQVNIGKWIKSNLPDEKAFGLNDIGAITYITKKPIIDMAGLVTPEIFKFQKMSYEDGSKSLLKLLKDKNVNYIIIYPDWYDYIMEHYSSAFQQVYSAKLQNNTICGGIEMFVYKINWDKINLN